MPEGGSALTDSEKLGSASVRRCLREEQRAVAVEGGRNLKPAAVGGRKQQHTKGVGEWGDISA